MLAAKRLTTTIPRPQLHLTQHPRNSLLTPIRTLSITPPLHSDPPAAAQAHSNTAHAGSSGGHDAEHSHYDPPGGWLWGLPPGEKYEKEGWENVMIYGFFGSFVVATIAYVFKEDTSIHTWALEEARRRLEKEGILEDPNPTPTSILTSVGKSS